MLANLSPAVGTTRTNRRHQEGVIKAYQALLREGTRADQNELLNAGLLVRVWNELMLPVRCRSLWENKFPQLAQRS